MVSRGQFAQRGLSKGVKADPRKDNWIWGLRVYSPDQNQFTDVRLDIAIREMDQKDVEFWGKGKISGGWKLTVPGQIEYAATVWGTVGPLSEDIVLVRGTAYTTANGRPVITGERVMTVAAVNPVYSGKRVQEYWIFAGDRAGGPTRV